MDMFPVENVIQYQQLLQFGGNNEFECFLEEKCLKNDDYLNELIGTKYLRLEKFEEAIPYLSKVSNRHVENMNVYAYFHSDPFREIYENRNTKKPCPAFKLNYAKKMLKLQQEMKSEPSKEKKAKATWQYAIALKRSVSELESWALTTYYMGDGYGNFWNTFNDWKKPLLNHSEKLITQTVKTMEKSDNSAIHAKYDWYNKTTYEDFIEKHKTTIHLQQYLSECDYLNSYYTSQYIPQHINQKWAYKDNLDK
jgi:hypothetical protein